MFYLSPDYTQFHAEWIHVVIFATPIREVLPTEIKNHLLKEMLEDRKEKFLKVPMIKH